MKRQVAYVSPDLLFNPWGRVHKVVQFVRGFYPTWDQAYCERLMTSLDLGANDKISTLSFGARIKLALLLALAWRPKVLILDEPTVGLDAISKHAVFAELLAAVQDEERTVLISSHGLTDVERFADHLGMIKNGRLVVEGATARRHRAIQDGGPRRRRDDPCGRSTLASSCSGATASAGGCSSISSGPRWSG